MQEGLALCEGKRGEKNFWKKMVAELGNSFQAAADMETKRHRPLKNETRVL